MRKVLPTYFASVNNSHDSFLMFCLRFLTRSEMWVVCVLLQFCIILVYLTVLYSVQCTPELQKELIWLGTVKRGDLLAPPVLSQKKCKKWQKL